MAAVNQTYGGMLQFLALGINVSWRIQAHWNLWCYVWAVWLSDLLTLCWKIKFPIDIDSPFHLNNVVDTYVSNWYQKINLAMLYGYFDNLIPFSSTNTSKYLGIQNKLCQSKDEKYYIISLCNLNFLLPSSVWLKLM